jgi:hypothetical protein
MLQYTQITALIGELLYRHECVIVPNFGGFVSRRYSSGFSKGNNLLYPQSKHILFNRNLLHNDGLLVSALAEKTGVSYGEAERQVTDYRDYLQSLLNAKKRFELANIGLLYIDAENSLRFESKTDVNFLLESFGFEPVVANELLIEPEKTTRENHFEDRKAVVPVPEKRKRSYAKITALAVGIPAILGFLVLASYSKPMQPIMQSGLNPFYTPAKTYTPSKQTRSKAFFIPTAEKQDLLADANGYASFTVTENGNALMAEVAVTELKPDKTSVTKPHVVSNSTPFDGKYQVVVGCFGVENNAERLIKELSGRNISAGISGTNAKGLHIVSCGGFDSKEDAANLLATIKSNYPNAWVMTK